MTAYLDTTIPSLLIEQIERGNVLLFIGEAIVHDNDSVSVPKLLHNALATRLDDKSADQHFPEITQDFEQRYTRAALIQLIRNELESLGDEPQELHRLIAKLTPCTTLVTTAFNRRLERAFDEIGRSLQVMISNYDIPFKDEHHTTLYKLRGAVDQPETLILTTSDHYRFFRERDQISALLRANLAQKTILFVGYDLSDPYFQRLYYEATAPLDRFARPSYAFNETPSRVRPWCQSCGIQVLDISTTDFLSELVTRLECHPELASSALERMVKTAGHLPSPAHPYKQLNFYEASDRAIFFGRDEEIHWLCGLIRAHRLTMVYGVSGVGKTSLLLAGIGPELEQGERPYVTIAVRAVEDPGSALRRSLRMRLPQLALPKNTPLIEVVAAATRAFGRPLTLIFDQFEEFFIQHSPATRDAFITELVALNETRELPVKLVISLREDWLASMSEIERRIPQLFNTRMRVLPLTRTHANRSIVAPAEQFKVSYEGALIERLLDDLTGSGTEVLPPQLQLVCSALYDQRGEGISQLTLEGYEKIGGARELLQRYLQNELARLPFEDRMLTRRVLAELVTSVGTKAVKADDELALALEMPLERLEKVLEWLIRTQLLRRLEREGGATVYELAHEYLISQIEIDPDIVARKQAEELVRQGAENWGRLGILLPENVLSLVAPRYKELRLSAEEQKFVTQSTAYHLKRMQREQNWLLFLGALGGGLVGGTLYILCFIFLVRTIDELSVPITTALRPSVSWGMLLGVAIGAGGSLGRWFGNKNKFLSLTSWLLTAILVPLVGGTDGLGLPLLFSFLILLIILLPTRVEQRWRILFYVGFSNVVGLLIGGVAIWLEGFESVTRLIEHPLKWSMVSTGIVAGAMFVLHWYNGKIARLIPAGMRISND